MSYNINKSKVLLCPACGSSNRCDLFHVREHEYDNTTRDLFPYVECTKCSLRYLAERPAESELGAIYPQNYYAYVLDAQSEQKLEQDQSGLFSNYAERLFIGRLKPLFPHIDLNPKTRWLEIGCGRGSSMDSLYRFFGFRCHGVDVSQDAVSLCTNRGFTAVAVKFEEYLPSHGHRYDVIHSSHLIEHVADPNLFMRKHYDLLDKDGLAVVVTPNIDTWESRLLGKHWGGLHAPRHWTMFNRKSIQMLAERNGFELVDTIYSTNGVFWVWSLHSWLLDLLGKRIADTLCPSDHRFVDSKILNLARLGAGTFLDRMNLLLTGQSANMTVILRKSGLIKKSSIISIDIKPARRKTKSFFSNRSQVYARQFKLDYLIRKPRLIQRIILHNIYTLLTKKTRLRSVDIGVTKKCNLQCSHCYASNFLQQDTIDLPTLEKGIKEALHLGAWHFLLLGGEPFFDTARLEKIIDFCEPHRSYITVVTNGYGVTRDMLLHFQGKGVDKIGVSLESFIPEEHDRNRNKPGCFDHAMQTLEMAHSIGLSAAINTTVTRKSFESQGFRKMISYTREHPNITLDVNIAMPVGNWEGRADLMLEPNQVRFLEQQFNLFGNVRRDTYPRFLVRGCPAVKESISINQAGDVYPCVFIHTSLGNLKFDRLSNIIDRAKNFEPFRVHHPVCLCGEDMWFYNNYLRKTFEKPKPYDGISLYKIDDK